MLTRIVKHHRTIYERDDFTIGVYLSLDGSNHKFCTCKGYGLPKTNSCFYQFTGEEVVEKGKKVFQVSSVEMAVMKSRAGIISFFKQDEFLGIGKKTIEALVDAHGDKLFSVIKNEPDTLLNVPGMSQDKLNILITGYREVSSLSELTQFLNPMGIAYRTQRIINRSLGSDAVDVIKRNPFELLQIKGIGFRTCDTIARYLNISLTSPERLKGGVLEALSGNSSSGDTYMIDDSLVNEALKKLNDGLPEAPVMRKDVIAAIMTLIQDEQIIVEDKHKMFTSAFWRAEEETAFQIRNMLKVPVSLPKGMLESDIIHKSGLSDEQIAAVKTSLSRRISIITGGAGTGKTTVINTIIKAYRNSLQNARITLLAPTGKAARRISEVTGIPAFTIHSRLGLNEGVEEPTDHIGDGLVIVDEASMIDMMLLKNLISAISIRCQLILLGDINQLPSVAAGACLRDMIASEVIPVSRLTKIFRQKNNSIVPNSLKVIRKDCGLIFDKSVMMVPANSESDAVDVIKRAYNYYAKEEGIENVALISPLRSTQDGRFICVADKLNEIIQETLPNDAPLYTVGAQKFRLNDRVMIWKNTQQASNGDIGTVIKIDDNHSDWGFEMTVKWENGNICQYHKNDLEKITLAYSMSVHKSQGSEYNTVIIPVLSEQKCRLFRNNLLYTALTRAKKRVVFIGDTGAINYMINHTETNNRRTLFRQRLISGR